MLYIVQRIYYAHLLVPGVHSISSCGVCTYGFSVATLITNPTERDLSIQEHINVIAKERTGDA